MNRILILVTVILLALGVPMVSAQSGYDLYQKALVKERAVGDVEEALRLYQRIVKEHGSNRSLAAKAQLRMGLLYERLGRKAEAQRAFQAVVTQYADQADVVKQAQAKLTAMANDRSLNAGVNNKAATGLRVRQVLVGPDVNLGGAVSPDGRYLSGVDRETPNLTIQDLITGEKRRLTNKTSKDEWDETPIFSPDGKQIVYTWGINKDKKTFYELRVIGIDGSGSRVLYRNENDIYPYAYAWSPDGKLILAELDEETANSGKDSIVLISVADGSARILKSLSHETQRGSFGGMYFSPDGRYIAYSYYPQNGFSQRDISVIASDGSRDVPLVQSPADDNLLGWAPDGKSILFTSDRSKTIDAWVIPVADGKPQGSPEIVKRDIGRVQPMGFTRSGSFYYRLGGDRGRQTIDIYTATLAPETGKLIGTPVLAKTRYIGANSGVDWSPDGRQLVYRSLWGAAPVAGMDDEGNAFKLVILNPETGEEREVPSKLKRFYPPRWSRDGKSILAGELAGSSPGAGLFKIDIETGDATLLIPQKPETWSWSWSPDGKARFYISKNALWIRNPDTGEEREIYRPTPPIENFSTNNNNDLSPDGKRLAFKSGQSLIVVPTTGGDARELLKLQESETFPNAWGTVVWTPDGRYLLFVQRGSELWRIPVDGGEPQKLGQLMELVQGLRVNPDGQRIAFNVYQKNKAAEVWVMENFLPTTQPRKTSVTKR